MLGAGPGGYTAAFRAADLGKKVVLVERWPTLGGVCLNVGCIPSKALLHAAKVIDEGAEMAAHGLAFGAPAIDLDKLRGWKDGVVEEAGRRSCRPRQAAQGHGRRPALAASPAPHEIEVDDGGWTVKRVTFEPAIIAAGSEPVTLPFIPHDDPRVIDSTGALELADIPKRLLVIGGGIIGLEMATVYHALGVEGHGRRADGPAHPRRRQGHRHARCMKRIEKRYENDLPQDQGDEVEAPRPTGCVCHFEGARGADTRQTFDRVLVAVGRRPTAS